MSRADTGLTKCTDNKDVFQPGTVQQGTCSNMIVEGTSAALKIRSDSIFQCMVKLKPYPFHLDGVLSRLADLSKPSSLEDGRLAIVHKGENGEGR